MCEHIHLPLQSGSSRILKAMRRTYDRARYLDRVALIREHVPDAALTHRHHRGLPRRDRGGLRARRSRSSRRSATTAPSRSSSRRAAAPRPPRSTEGLVPAPGQGGADGAAGGARPAQGARARPALRGAHAGGARRRPLAHRPRAAAGPHPPQQGRQLRRPRGARESSTDVEILAATSQTLSGEESLAGRGRRRDEDPRGRARGVRQARWSCEEVELAEPGPGRGARAPGRLRRLPHRHVHGLGRRSLRLRADGARPRGRGGGRALRRGRDAAGARATTWSRCSRRSAASACTAVSPLTNLCLAIREQQNLGYLPDGTTRLSRDGEPLRHFMGTSTFAEYTVMPRDRAREDRSRGAAGPRLPVRLRPLDRPRRGDEDGRGAAPGSTCVVFGAGHGRPRRRRRLPAAGRRADRVRGPLARAARARARPGRHRRDRRAARTPSQRDPRDDRRLRRRLHLRGDRQRGRDAPGGRGRADGLGPVHGLRRRRHAARRSTSSRAC